MKKTVKYNGGKVKVEFSNEIHEYTVNKTWRGRNIDIDGVEKFTINGKDYFVNFKQTCNIKTVRYSITYNFEGFSCGDSHKKIIEFIISKYGI